MNEIEILKEINKDAKTGLDGINFTLNKVKDDKLKNIIYNEKNSYQNIYDRSKALLSENNEDLKDTSNVQKAMSWMGVELNTLIDKSISQIAQILIQGNNIGVIKGTKLLNNIEFKNNKIKEILQDFVSLQEKNITELKSFL